LASLALVAGSLASLLLFLALEVQRPLRRLEGALAKVGLDSDLPQPPLVASGGTAAVRRLTQRQGGLWLLASDGATVPIPLQAEGVGGAELWGVVIHAVHHLAGAPSRRR
jgi:hypothetical protein